jgi:hypothetical protein
MLVLQSLLLSVGIEALAYLKSIVVSYLYDDDGTSGPEVNYTDFCMLSAVPDRVNSKNVG